MVSLFLLQPQYVAVVDPCCQVPDRSWLSSPGRGAAFMMRNVDSFQSQGGSMWTGHTVSHRVFGALFVKGIDVPSHKSWKKVHLNHV